MTRTRRNPNATPFSPLELETHRTRALWDYLDGEDARIAAELAARRAARLASAATVTRYRNRHTGDTVTIVNGTMSAGTLYAYVDGDPDTYTPRTFGLEGRDGTTFDPRHWTRIDGVTPPAAGPRGLTPAERRAVRARSWSDA